MAGEAAPKYGVIRVLRENECAHQFSRRINKCLRSHVFSKLEVRSPEEYDPIRSILFELAALMSESSHSSTLKYTFVTLLFIPYRPNFGIDIIYLGFFLPLLFLFFAVKF